MDTRVKEYIYSVLKKKGHEVHKNKTALLEAFANDTQQQADFIELERIQNGMIDRWKEKNLIDDIKTKQVIIPNAQVGKPYSFRFDIDKLGLNDLSYFELTNYADAGLEFDTETHTLQGVPNQSGEFKILFRFRTKLSAEDAQLEEKTLALIVNADPKSLWKNIEPGADELYWKGNTATMRQTIAGRTLVVASGRGRSHAHEGKFREDDYAAASFDNGWGIIAVSDGAGSAKYARKGSLVACESVVEYFRNTVSPEEYDAFETAITTNYSATTPETQKELSSLIIKHLSGAANFAHTSIGEEAKSNGSPIKDYSATLLFTLIKKFDVGYFIGSFWVGDGGVGIYDKPKNEITILGISDGGEFAGQTRFITMTDIFKQENGFYNRFMGKKADDFTAIVLMSDGITDPKFSTDANLGRIEKWNDLWDDLAGKNDDNAAVNFDAANENIEKELLTWLDFWSPGNHDDRTIAILF